jgi:hypothetical protein
VPVPRSSNDLYAALLAFDWYIIPTSSAVFRREAVERLGGFRDPWGADVIRFKPRLVSHGQPATPSRYPE